MPAPRPTATHDWIVPQWGAAAGVGALMSTRIGGSSAAPWNSLNLGDHVGDDPQAVARNRLVFAAATGAAPVYLRQVHGCRVVRLGAADAGAAPPEADAALSTDAGVACTVLVADCLPVLLAAPAARGVAAAHAGWRGLAAGVLEATVEALCEATASQPGELAAWLGPCIGPAQFEVGGEVPDAFCGANAEAQRRFLPGRTAGKWWADLAGLAADRLRAAGVRDITGGQWCTVDNASRFFSYRRDGVTGRMAAAVWLDGASGGGR